MIIISSCLAGKRCRYDGSGCLDQELLDNVGAHRIDMCPELLGGFSVPRLPCEIVGGDGADVLAGNAAVIDREGNDITAAMLAGACRALDNCLRSGAVKAYVKNYSPSCGCGKIYDGSFSSVLKKGNGIFTELLLSCGIEAVGH